MKKLIFILLVLFLLSAPAIAQAHADGKCKKDEASCATTQDDGRGDGDKSDGQDRNGHNQDGGNGDDDDESQGRHDRDKDKDDDHNDRDNNNSGGRHGDDEGGNAQDDKDKKDKKDKRDRGYLPGDDDGEEPGDVDDDSDDKPKKDGCRTIGSGEIITSKGELIVMGYDRWGYNYEAHSFNGWAENADRDGTPVASGKIRFKMKWNDVYLSNKDCDGDGHLDRHYGYDSYYGTRAWLTNTYMWSYIGDDGQVHWVHWFLKMVAKPNDGFSCASIGGTPFNSHFCVVRSNYVDPCGGSQGIAALISGFGIEAK